MSPAPELVERDKLASRIIPSMVFSDGSESSMTPPPKVSTEKDPTVSARQRFAVRGNAVVAGGAGNLGLESCRALLEHGLHSLAIIDIDPAQSQKDIDQLKTQFPSADIFAFKVDVTDDVNVAFAMQKAADKFGSIDILIYFVGIVSSVDALEMPIAQWRRILDVNTTGAMICAQAAARHMVKQGTGGSITFISSISAHRVNYPQPQVAYNVSKAALLMMKNRLAAEWAQYGIRTNTLSPGYMDTILNEGGGLASHRKIWAERNPSGRMGSPSELTGAIVLISSSSGSYINGTDIVVGGGGLVL